MRHGIVRLLLLAACVGLARDALPQADAEDATYFVADLDVLIFLAPRDRGDGIPTGTREDALSARTLRVLLDGPGEAAVVPAGVAVRNPFRNTIPARSARVALRLDEPRDVTGRLLVPDAEGSAQVAVEFAVSASDFRVDARDDWLRAVAGAADARISAQDTGAAWFRHVRAAALAELGEPAPTPANEGVWIPAWPARGSALEQIGMFSGGRAMSENLALDRLLPLTADAEDSIVIADVPGVTVADYPWGPLIEGLTPARDPLAALIPADQHGIFFPSIEAALSVLEQVDALTAVFEGATQVRSEDADTRERYERQLGLRMDGPAREFGPLLVGSVALTGGDPYLRTGSDVALLFESRPQREGLTQAAIAGSILAELEAVPGVERSQSVIEGVTCTVLRSVDRSVSAYIGFVEGAVVVANSPTQIARIARIARGDEPALADTPEYTFFRDRYALGDASESALVVLSDATIRRWCGPRVRIGSARRTRAAAVLAELTARSLAEPGPAADAAAGPRELTVPDTLPSLGALRMPSGRVHSPTWGNLAFATPIGELDIERVTLDEAVIYQQWRSRYEGTWTDAFDPIAIRIGVGANGSLSTDVTVRPLIAGSAYLSYIDITRNGSIAPHAGDLHPGTLVQLILGVHPGALSELTGASSDPLGLGVNLLDWIGGSFSISLDDMPLPEGLAEGGDAFEFLAENPQELPLAVQFEVGHGLKLAAFLTAMRGVIESMAPGIVAWENREHAGHSYVRAFEREPGQLSGIEDMDLAVFYFVSSEHLTLSWNEALIRRVIERHAARAAARAAGEPTVAESEQPWIGEHVGLRIDVPAALATLTATGQGLGSEMQRASWANLAILNVWRRLDPDRDPLALHEAAFARTLVCPGGEGYRWNAAWQTMESVVYGHPGAPLAGRTVPPFIDRVACLRLGLTFEDDGLRARAELETRDGQR